MATVDVHDIQTLTPIPNARVSYYMKIPSGYTTPYIYYTDQNGYASVTDYVGEDAKLTVEAAGYWKYTRLDVNSGSNQSVGMTPYSSLPPPGEGVKAIEFNQFWASYCSDSTLKSFVQGGISMYGIGARLADVPVYRINGKAYVVIEQATAPDNETWMQGLKRMIGFAWNWAKDQRGLYALFIYAINSIIDIGIALVNWGVTVGTPIANWVFDKTAQIQQIIDDVAKTVEEKVREIYNIAKETGQILYGSVASDDLAKWLKWGLVALAAFYILSQFSKGYGRGMGGRG